MTDEHDFISAVQVNLAMDDDALFRELGRRQQAMLSAPRMAGDLNPEMATYSVEPLAFKEDAVELGRRLFKRWSSELYDVVCGKGEDDRDDREKILNAANLSQAAVTGLLVSALVGLGAAPTIAVIVAALLFKRVFSPAGDEICRFWGERLESD